MATRGANGCGIADSLELRVCLWGSCSSLTTTRPPLRCGAARSRFAFKCYSGHWGPVSLLRLASREKLIDVSLEDDVASCNSSCLKSARLDVDPTSCGRNADRQRRLSDRSRLTRTELEQSLFRHSAVPQDKNNKERHKPYFSSRCPVMSDSFFWCDERLTDIKGGRKRSL